MLTEAEKKWLEERNDSIRPAPCVTAGMRGWAFSARDCRDSSCDYNRQFSPKYCPLASDYRDAAEFEARVAALLSVSENRLTPCLTDPNPETRGECKQWRFYWRNSYAVYWGCAACRLKYARLAVEQEMEKEGK